MPTESLFKALTRHISWSMNPRHRLLTFLRLSKTHIHVTGDSFVAKDSKKRPPEVPRAKAELAREALLAHGTPMRLLELVYLKLSVRLVICSGKTCRYVHTPFDLGGAEQT